VGLGASTAAGLLFLLALGGCAGGMGHVNALGGNKGIFADLQKLSPGADITVLRADGSTAVFRMERGARYSKNDFPTLEVYGNTQAPSSGSSRATATTPPPDSSMTTM
jgi:ABC-type phosphate transport system substrate-binding protein